MAKEFDPYHVWLGISKDEQPPSHYRLLGLSPFEDSPAAIENAADRQMAHLRAVATGQRAELTQQILNEIARAKLVLLDPEKKAAYDRKLKAKRSAGKAASSSQVAKRSASRSGAGKAASSSSKLPKASSSQSGRRPAAPRSGAGASKSGIQAAPARQRSSAAGQSGSKDEDSGSSFSIDLGEADAPASSYAASRRQKKRSVPVVAAASGGFLLLVVFIAMLTLGGGSNQQDKIAKADDASADETSTDEAETTDDQPQPFPPEENPGNEEESDGGPSEPPRDPSHEPRHPAEGMPKGPDTNDPPGGETTTKDSPPPDPGNDPPPNDPGGQPPNHEPPQTDPPAGNTEDPPADPGATEPAEERLPLPSAQAREKARADIEALYDIASVKKAVEQRTLAASLLKLSESTADTALRYELLVVARGLGMQGGDPQTTFAAVDALTDIFECEEPFALRLAAFQGLKFDDVPDDGGQLWVERARSVIDEAVVRERYEEALELCQKAALSATRTLKNRRLSRIFDGVEDVVREFQKSHDMAQRALSTLEETADDPEASLQAGRYLCFVAEDWEQGLPLLAHGRDPKLASLAEADLEGTKVAGQQVAIGDRWWEVADRVEDHEQRGARRRAAAWYDEALIQLSALQAAKVAPRLQAIQQPSSPLADPSLLLHYRFDQIRGKTVEDQSWKGHDGQIVGQPNFDRETGAIEFAGRSMISIDAVEDIQLTTEFTIAFWLKTLHNGTVLTKRPRDGSFPRGSKGVPVNDGRPRFNISGHGDVSGNLLVADGRWHHVAIVARPWDGRKLVYVDAQLCGNRQFNEADVPGSILVLGGNDKDLFPGAIADLRIYNRPLEGHEITGLARRTWRGEGDPPGGSTSASVAPSGSKFLAYLHVRNRTYPEFGNTHDIPFHPDGPRCRAWNGAPQLPAGGYALEFEDSNNGNFSDLRVLVVPEGSSSKTFRIEAYSKNAGFTYDLLGPRKEMLVENFAPRKSAVVSLEPSDRPQPRPRTTSGLF